MFQKIKSVFTPEEEKILILLLEKMKLPVGYDLFLALMRSIPSCPVELAVFNDSNQILLFHRKDKEYNGYHSPGTVLRNDDTVQLALERLKLTELKGMEISEITPLGWHETLKGAEYGQNPTRHEISLIHACKIIGNYTGEGKFFPIDDLPEDLIPHHKVLIPEIVRRYKVS